MADESRKDRKYVNVRLSAKAKERLDVIAEESRLAPARVAGLLLEELIPTVVRVRTRLQVEREKSDKPDGKQ